MWWERLWLSIVVKYNNNRVLSFVSRCSHLWRESRRLDYILLVFNSDLYFLLKGTLSCLKYNILLEWPVACYNCAILSCNRKRKMLKVVKAKKYQLRGKSDLEKVQNFTMDILSKNQSQSTSILATLYFFLDITVLSCFVGSFYQIYLPIYWGN